MGTAPLCSLVGTLPPHIPVVDSLQGDQSWSTLDCTISLGLLNSFQGVNYTGLWTRQTFILPRGGLLSSQDGVGVSPGSYSA